MKNILALILFTLCFSSVKSQDFIVSKDGPIYNVKIVKMDKGNLYVYMAGDSTKSIRKIPFTVISSYEYPTKNDPKYRAEDSALFAKYTLEKEFNMMEYSETPVDRLVDLKMSSPAEYYFTRAQNQFIASTVCAALGVIVINVIAKNIPVPKDVTNPNYLTDLDDYIKSVDNLQKIQYGLLGTSLVLTFASGHNFFNGFVELKKLQKQAVH